MSRFELKQFQSDASTKIDSVNLQLILAIKESDTETIKKILSIQPDLINKPNGPLLVPPLHLALFIHQNCVSIIHNEIELIKLLLSYDADVRQKDKLGRTALHYAVIKSKLALIQLFLDNGADINARYETGFSRKLLYSNDHEIFSCLPIPSTQGQTPLHLAVTAKRNRRKMVKLLLEHNANANAVDEHEITPILLAGATLNLNGLQEYEDIISLLIQYHANVNIFICYTGSTALHHSVALNSLPATKALINAGAKIFTSYTGQTPVHVAAAKGHSNILSYLLQCRSNVGPMAFGINYPDYDGRTALHKAAFAGSTDCVRLLVEKGGDLSARSKTRITVMDILFSHIPNAVQLVSNLMNDRITYNSVPDVDTDLKIKLDFSILISKEPNKQMGVIEALLNAGKPLESFKLLQHPLIETYLCLKWDRLKVFFTLLIFIHVLFVISLSTYILLIIHYPPWADILITISRISLLFLSAILFLVALIQIYQSIFVLRNSITQYEIWINTMCAAVSFVIAGIGFFEENHPPDNWILHTTSYTVLLASIELMLLIGKHPRFGYYVLMFYVVLQNVLKVLLTFICLVIGFSTSFAIQLHTFAQFKNPWSVFIKTITMTMGEYEYADIFLAEDAMVLPITSSLIFIVFILLSSIVLMNLMLGVAINDIQSLQKVAHALSLAKQARFLSQIEIFLSKKYFFACCMPTNLIVLLQNRRTLESHLVLRPELLVTENYIHINKNMKCIPKSVLESLIQLATKNFNDKKAKNCNEEITDFKTVMNLLTQMNERMEIIESNLKSNNL